MKKNEKIWIIFLLIVLIILVIISFSIKKKEDVRHDNVTQTNEMQEEFVKVLEGNIKINISDELKKEKIIDGIKISNIQLTKKDGQSVLLADITNINNVDKSVIGIYIIMLDKNGKEMVRIPGAISPLKAGQTKQLNIGITLDCVNAYNFKVEKQ